MQPLSERARLVLRELERDPGARCSRGVLSAATGLGDRAVREAVAELVARGWPVLSDSGEAGYALARSAEEVARAKEEVMSRIRMLSVRARGLTMAQRAMLAAPERQERLL